MALYNYSKYTVSQYWNPQPWVKDYNTTTYFMGLHRYASWDAVNKKYDFSVPWGANESVPPGSIAYSGNNMQAYKIISIDSVTKKASEGINTEQYLSTYYYATTAETQGSYVGSVVAENGTYPTNGKHTDGYWYVRGSAYVPPNNAPTIPGEISVTGEFKTGNTVTLNWGASTDSNGDPISYQPDAVLYKNGVEQPAVALTPTSARTTTYTIPNDPTITKVHFRIRATDGKAWSPYRTSGQFNVTSNSAPTIVVNTTDNRTLYENDVIALDGTATDVNNGNVVSVKYQINSGAVKAITSSISTGAAIPFNKSLTFKNNALYDGTTLIAENLAEGTQHALKVWSEDDQGGKSEVVTRNFYVVPNRPATLTMDPFTVRNDLIDSDVVTISGNVSDPDNNGVTVKFKIANGSFTEVYSGQGGAFSFQVQLANLAVGANTLTVQAVDSYGAITSKTLNVTKTEKLQPLLTADTRYRVTPPNGTATGIVLWLHREVGDLAVNVEISMTAAGEPENFVPMNLHSTAFVSEGLEEDEFRYDAGTAKEVITLKITQTRTSPTSTKGIKQISGVLT